MKILLILILLPIVVIFTIFGAWFIAVPEDMISDYITNSVKSDKIIIKTQGIKKGLFLNLNIRKIDIKKKDETPLLTIENVHAKPDFMSLLKLNPQLPFTGQIHSGLIEGVYSVKEEALKLNGRDINLKDITSLKLVNVEGEGNLSIKMEIIRGQGDVLFNVKDARLKQTILPGGYFLPLNLFNDIKGLLAVKKDVLEVKAFSLEGEGVYARIKGNITGSDVDLNMELMPDASFQKPSMLLLISPFQVSPGYYLIPIKLKGLLI